MSPVRILFAVIGILIIIGAYRWWIRFESTEHIWPISSDSYIFSPEHKIGVDWDLFRWPKKSYQTRVDLIYSSSGHLDIWIYDITFRNLRDLLIQKTHTIPVRLIIEQNKYKDDGKQIAETVSILSKWWVQVHDDAALNVNFTHAKTFVSSQFALIQTSNLTKNSFDNNREYYFVTRDQNIISNLQMLFDRDRKWQKILKSDVNHNLLVCPLDCRLKISKLISDAQKSIIIQNQQIDDIQLITLLNRRIQEGIKVQIIVADKEGADNLTLQFPLGTVRKLKKPYPHAKMMLIDDKILKISSINFTTNSMDNNREIGILTDSKKAIEDFSYNFQTDRKVSRR